MSRQSRCAFWIESNFAVQFMGREAQPEAEKGRWMVTGKRAADDGPGFWISVERVEHNTETKSEVFHLPSADPVSYWLPWNCIVTMQTLDDAGGAPVGFALAP